MSRTFIFYLSIGMQLVGLASVGICFVSGIQNGDYGHLELVQFLGGAGIFYFGAFLKTKGV